jgi:hypothetical protein
MGTQLFEEKPEKPPLRTANVYDGWLHRLVESRRAINGIRSSDGIPLKGGRSVVSATRSSHPQAYAECVRPYHEERGESEGKTKWHGR